MNRLTSQTFPSPEEITKQINPNTSAKNFTSKAANQVSKGFGSRLFRNLGRAIDGVNSRNIAKLGSRLAPVSGVTGSVAMPLAATVSTGIGGALAADAIVDHWANDPIYMNSLDKLNDLKFNKYLKAGIIQDDDGVYMDTKNGRPLSESEVRARLNNLENVAQENRDALVRSIVREEEEIPAAIASATPAKKTNTAASTRSSSTSSSPLYTPGFISPLVGNPNDPVTQAVFGNPLTNKNNSSSSKGNSLDWLNRLLPLLAIGGLGYLAGRR